jgi:hypothetical protein
MSHATGGSVGKLPLSHYRSSHPNNLLVPNKAQEKLPKGVEESVPNAVHDTGSQGRVSHATGDSKVPKKVQEIVPEGLERALPDKIHDTSALPPKH